MDASALCQVSRVTTLTVREMMELYESLYSLHGDMIRRSLRETNARYIVLCNGKVVLTSNDHHGPSISEISRLEKRHGKICYVIGAEVIEDSAWSQVGEEDFYPTLPIHVGLLDWGSELVFEKINADFDTGNPDVSAFSIDDLEALGVQTPAGHEVWSDIHLTHHYYYVWRNLKIGARDGKAQRCVHKHCKCIINWRERDLNPFLITNPTREGFVGRDLLLLFPLEIILNGSKKATDLRLL